MIKNEQNMKNTYSAQNLQFANYDESTETNNNVEALSEILVYEDDEHTIFLTINNTAPFEVFLVDTFHDEDYVVIDRANSAGIEQQLIEYLNQ
jgi:hypothetical protein